MSISFSYRLSFRQQQCWKFPFFCDTMPRHFLQLHSREKLKRRRSADNTEVTWMKFDVVHLHKFWEATLIHFNSRNTFSSGLCTYIHFESISAFSWHMTGPYYDINTCITVLINFQSTFNNIPLIGTVITVSLGLMLRISKLRPLRIFVRFKCLPE